MRSAVLGFVAILATGLTFGLMFWVLENMSVEVRSFVIAFVLGGCAEALRRWLVKK